jgi:hypothetical protein
MSAAGGNDLSPPGKPLTTGFRSGHLLHRQTGNGKKNAVRKLPATSRQQGRSHTVTIQRQFLRKTRNFVEAEVTLRNNARAVLSQQRNFGQ